MDEVEQPVNQDSAVAENNSAAEESVTNPPADQAESEQVSSEAESGDSVAEDEHGELEVDGEKYSLPKKVAERLNSERMMNADYTRKTQALAEDRRQLESQSENLAKQYQVQQQFLQDNAKVISLDNQLAEYEKLDWGALIQQDPVQAMQYQHQQQELRRQRDEAQRSIAQKQEEFALSEQQAIAKQAKEAMAYVQREISGWTPERDNQLSQYAKDQGFDVQKIGRIAIEHPALFKVLHKAEMYDRLAKNQAKPQQQASAAKPVPKVGSNKSVQKDPSNMTDKEFAEWRKQQIRNR
jgi:hypothetical protein